MTDTRTDTLHPDQDQLRRFWCALVKPGDVHEVRIPRSRKGGPRRFYGTVSGYFDDADAFVEEIGAVTGHDAEGVYVTLNPVNPALRARANNRLQAGARDATADRDVLRRSALLIDVDPDRPAGISATDEEMAAALRLRDKVQEFLRWTGWPDPIAITSSGNGGGLLYRIDLANDDEANRLVAAVLKTLHRHHGNGAAKIDVSVANASRITKVVGTVAAKGDHLDERPWRLATASFPDRPGTVTIDQLRAVSGLDEAEPNHEREPGAENGYAERGASRYDIPAILDRNDIHWESHETGYATIYRLDRCLTSPDHSDGAALIVFASGGTAYRCHHDRCSDKRWNPHAREALGLADSGFEGMAVSGHRETKPLSPAAGAVDWSRFGNFTARIVRDVSIANGLPGDRRVAFDLEVRVDEGSPLVGRIDARDFQDGGKLRATLQVIGRSRLRIEDYDATALRKAIQLSSQTAAVETIYEHTGWEAIGGEEHFLMPKSSVGTTQPIVALPEEPGLARYGFADLSDEGYRRALEVVAGPLFAAMPERVAYPALAQAFLPPIHRYLGTAQRYMLHLCGETGTLKTTFASLLMGLWGRGFVDGSPTTTWGSTVNAIERLGFVAKDALMLVDDFKPAIVEQDGVKRLIQNYGDGTGRARLTGAAELNPPTPIRAHLLSTGEDLPRGEASSIARTLVLLVVRGDARHDQIGLVQAESKLLSGLMPGFIRWLLRSADRAKEIAQNYDAQRSDLMPRVAQRGGANPNRIAQNLAMNAAAFGALVGWMEAEQAITADDARDRRDRYAALLDDLIDRMTDTVRHERASTIFVETLGTLAVGGEYTILDRPEYADPLDRVVLGWRDGSTTYLFPDKSFTAVSSVRQLNVSERALREQLDADGMLADRDEGQLTVRRRLRGHQHRVLALKSDYLGFAPSAPHHGPSNAANIVDGSTPDAA